MAWTPELEAEYQALEAQYGNQPAVPPAITSNPGANQKLLEAQAAAIGKAAGEGAGQAQTKSQLAAVLDDVKSSIEATQKAGGFNPIYDNEELLFGVLPGVKPTVQFMRNQGYNPGGIGDALTAREVYQSKTGLLATVLKGIIRKPGEGVWTDADQKYLLSLLPSGAGYQTDKQIADSLSESALINAVNAYRASPEWQSGLQQTQGALPPQQSPQTLPQAPQAPQSPAPAATQPVSWQEFFK